MNMKRFYKRQLLEITHKYSGTLYIAKWFFCFSWEKVNANAIQKTNVKNKFLVPSTKENTGLFYIVNSEIEVCFYPIEMSDALYKYQGAVSVKFHILIFNFILSLILNNHIIYAYIALSK